MSGRCLLDRGSGGAMFIDGAGVRGAAHYRRCARSPRRYVTTVECGTCRHKMRGLGKCRGCSAPILARTGRHGDLCDACAFDAMAEETTLPFPKGKRNAGDDRPGDDPPE